MGIPASIVFFLSLVSIKKTLSQINNLECNTDFNKEHPVAHRNFSVLGGHVYYLDSLAFKCSGTVQEIKLKANYTSSNPWASRVGLQIEILRANPSELGQFIVIEDFNFQVDSAVSSEESYSVNLNSSGTLSVQSGDFLKITSPIAIYNNNILSYVNTHIPVVGVSDVDHSLRHFPCISGCTSQQISYRMLIDFVMVDGFLPSPGPPNDLIDITQGVSVPLIASVVVLALIVILLSIVVVLLIVRKRKADKVTKTDPKNKSKLYRHNLDDPLPPVHSQPVQVPLEGDLDYSYATITGSGHTRNTLETDENYAIPLQPSHGTSEGSATPIPQFPNRTGSFTCCIVPTMEQRKGIRHVGKRDEMQYDIYETLWKQQSLKQNPGSIPIDVEVYCPPSEIEEEIYQQMADRYMYEIPLPSISIGAKLGEGEFGTVYKGKWISPGGKKDVAIKSLKDECCAKGKIKILREAAIMGQFNHPHVVRLYGAVTITDPILIIMELLPEGDLRNHLLTIRENENILKSNSLPHMLLTFCRQISEGMEYLSNKGFVHRDLAARNVLLDKEFNCKITDFGMSRDLDDAHYYVTQGGQIPVKWTAPEAVLYRKYSTASDVWSFGMLMFEIWSLGWKPFDNLSINEVVNIIGTGYCQPPPPGTTKLIYSIMVECWNPEPRSRPIFSDIVHSLNQPDSQLLARSDDRDEGSYLGGPLIDSSEMFQDLQISYKKF